MSHYYIEEHKYGLTIVKDNKALMHFKDVEDIAKRIDALEKALKYYSDLQNWHEDADNSVMDDIGKIAQDALDQLKKDL